MSFLLRRNRRERRQKATTADAAAFIGAAFTDRIAWVAARTLLVRILADDAVGAIDPSLRLSIERFLATHPAPERGEAPLPPTLSNAESLERLRSETETEELRRRMAARGYRLVDDPEAER